MPQDDIRIVAWRDEASGLEAAEFHLPGHLVDRRLSGYAVVYKALRWPAPWGLPSARIEYGDASWRILGVKVTAPGGAWAEAKVGRDGSLGPMLASQPNEELARALKQLSAAIRRGRPLGSTIYTREEFEARYREAYQGLRRSWRSPRQDQVAEALGLSERSLRDYLARFRLPWPPR